MKTKECEKHLKLKLLKSGMWHFEVADQKLVAYGKWPYNELGGRRHEI